MDGQGRQVGNTPNPSNGGQASDQDRWQLVWDVTHNKWYFVDKQTQKVSWEVPEGCSLALPTSPPAGAENLNTLPAGWKAYYDPKSRKMCFQHIETSKTQWERPDSNTNRTVSQAEENTSASNGVALPSGWRQVRDEDSQRDYYVSPGGVTQWEHPSQSGSPSKAAAEKAAADKVAAEKAAAEKVAAEKAARDKATPTQRSQVSSTTASDWEPRWDSENRRWCFVNAKSGKHQYDKRPDSFTKELPEPPELPPGWSAAWDDAQNRFYFLSPAKQSQWDPPPLTTNGQENAGARKAEDIIVPQAQNYTAPPNKTVAPEELPPGWEKAFNENYKRHYYFNRDTNETQWHPPDFPTGIDKQTSPSTAENLEKTEAGKIASTSPNEKATSENVKATTNETEAKKTACTGPNEKTLAENNSVTISNETNAKSSPNKAPPTKQNLSRTQLAILAKLVLKEDAEKPEIDVDGLLAKFWRDRPSTETTLEEFLGFIGVPQK